MLPPREQPGRYSPLTLRFNLLPPALGLQLPNLEFPGEELGRPRQGSLSPVNIHFWDGAKET